MFHHRFRDSLEALPTFHRLPVAESAAPFVPCPVMAVLSSSQQAAVVEIYRIAAERTEAQLRKARRRLPTFSQN